MWYCNTFGAKILQYLEAILSDIEYTVVSISLLADHVVDPLCDTRDELFMLPHLFSLTIW